MLHLYEFEVFEDEGWMVALPFDLDGGTQGRDFRDACEMAAEWLQMEMEHRAMHDLEVPESSLGHEPQHGGRVVTIAVHAGKDTVRKLSAADAARELGVTPGRVSQMIAAGQLEAFRDGHKTWVTEDSIKARINEKPKAGRPKTELVG